MRELKILSRSWCVVLHIVFSADDDLKISSASVGLQLIRGPLKLH